VTTTTGRSEPPTDEEKRARTNAKLTPHQTAQQQKARIAAMREKFANVEFAPRGDGR